VIIHIVLHIIIAIKLTDGGDFFYGQVRIGYKGRKFKVFKFRSMYMNADKKLKEILEKDPKVQEEWEKTFKFKKDPRVTPIGVDF